MPNWPAFRQLVFLNLFSLFEIFPFLVLKGASTSVEYALICTVVTTLISSNPQPNYVLLKR